jgi:TetR/AcrR family transcriptional repressor of nem operon
MVAAGSETQHESKTKFLNAALRVIRAKGYTATRVEDICEAAGLTKGSFFHHFSSKEDLAVAAAEHWSSTTGGLFAGASYWSLADPLHRLLAYVDFRKALLRGELPDFTCFVGTMVQEVYSTHPSIRQACEQSISGHAASLEPDIAEAMQKYGVQADWTPDSLALYTQAVIQGAFILAKAKEDPAVAAACLDHLRRYLEMLFTQNQIKGENTMATTTPTPMNLSTTSDTVAWPETHYVFLEKIGPFQPNAQQAWQELHQLLPAISEHNQITGYFSLYKVEPQIYRAGVSVAAKPAHLPAGVAYERLHGGTYARFTLSGSYSQLPEACGRVFRIVSENKLPLRDDYHIENYVNDPRTTPEDQLITEILVPVA